MCFPVRHGIFQTSAPFSFQSGDKVTFSGVHVPAAIVPGNIYTVSTTAPLSFKLSDSKFDDLDVHDHNAGIFMVRVWDDKDPHKSIIHATLQSPELVSAIPSKDRAVRTSEDRSNEALAAASITQPATPTQYSYRPSSAVCTNAAVFSEKCSNVTTNHATRCTSGKRRASSFVTNISPLQRNNAHDSQRSTVLLPVELPSK
jgi:hypothetical protein